MDRGAWQATVNGVAKTQTWLSDFMSFFQCFCIIFESLFDETRLTYFIQTQVILKVESSAVYIGMADIN